MKKILSIFLCLCLVIGIVPAAGLLTGKTAAYAEDEENIDQTLDISYNGSDYTLAFAVYFEQYEKYVPTSGPSAGRTSAQMDGQEEKWGELAITVFKDYGSDNQMERPDIAAEIIGDVDFSVSNNGSADKPYIKLVDLGVQSEAEGGRHIADLFFYRNAAPEDAMAKITARVTFKDDANVEINGEKVSTGALEMQSGIYLDEIMEIYCEAEGIKTQDALQDLLDNNNE